MILKNFVNQTHVAKNTPKFWVSIFLIESSDLDNICVENTSFGFLWLKICEDTKKKFGCYVLKNQG